LNGHNKTKRINTKSKFIGVYLEKKTNKFMAKIQKDKITFFIGRFKTELDAVKAYNEKAIELYGEYANLNILE
jgi:hypothetical protein